MMVPASAKLAAFHNNSGKQRQNSQHLAVLSFAKPTKVQEFREKRDVDG